VSGNAALVAVVRERLRDPVLWAGGLQLLKTVGAAVGAWVLAVRVFGLAQPFLAPWAALLTVHATVYRTLARGAQQVGMTVLGVLLAFVAGTLLGVTAASLAVVLFAGMLAGAVRVMRDESTTAAATALVVLLTGYSEQGDVLVARLLDTAIGIAVGLVVNLVVWPPLRDRSAARQVDAIDDGIGALLTDIAAGLRDAGHEVDTDAWIERTRDLDHDIDKAWGVVRLAHESGRLNLRRHAGARIQASDHFAELLTRLEQAVAETRSMARTIERAGLSTTDPRFRKAWLELLSRASVAVNDGDGSGVKRVRADLEGPSDSAHPAAAQPVHGALLVNLRNIVEAMEGVADAQPVRAATRKHPRLSA
jgi:uncharacterized membrane protein YgaE (UPF0421/DUF939 family)